MAIPKQKFRELLLLYLYSHDLGGMDEEELNLLVMDTLKVTKKTVKEASGHATLILGRAEEMDSVIKEISTSYALDRIQRIEKAILRLALYEMIHDLEIPKKVSIAEAMRLARKFSTKEAASFINALLDSAYKRMQGEEVEKVTMSVDKEAVKEVAAPV